MPDDAAAVEHLHRLEVIRERAWMLLAAAEREQSDHFQPSPEAVGAVAVALAELIRAAPQGETPPAAERAPLLANLWHGLRLDQPTALEALATALAGGDGLAHARSGADLAVLHRVIEPAGLPSKGPLLDALVTFFAAGGCTAKTPGAPALDAPGLRRILAGDGGIEPPEALLKLLAEPERRERLRLLASGLEQAPELFGAEGRFGLVLDRLVAMASGTNGGRRIDAQQVVDLLAPLIDPITASTVRLGGRLAGDVWRHPLAWAGDRSRELVPFHAVLLALLLDLVEPLQEAELGLSGIEHVPVPADRALAALMLRLGLVRPRHAAIARLRHPPGSDIVVELRALSVALADRLADRLRAELGRTAHDLPVAGIVGPLAQLASNWRDRPGPGIVINATAF